MRCPLHEYLAHNQLQQERLLRLAARLAAFAAATPAVCLSPAAVLVEETGRGWRFQAAVTAQTGAFLAADNLAYTAPERFGSDPAAAGEPARTYALAAMIWEIFTGRPPQPVACLEPQEALTVIRDTPAASLPLPSWVPPGPAALLRRALDIEPGARPAPTEICRVLQAAAGSGNRRSLGLLLLAIGLALLAAAAWLLLKTPKFLVPGP